MTSKDYVQLPTDTTVKFVPLTMLPRGNQVVWLVIRVHCYAEDYSHGDAPFEILAVFSGDGAEQKAVAACERRIDLVMPAKTNVILPDVTCGYYPLAKIEASE